MLLALGGGACLTRGGGGSLALAIGLRWLLGPVRIATAKTLDAAFNNRHQTAPPPSDPSSVRLLEVACGTGRLHTFLKDNYPGMQARLVLCFAFQRLASTVSAVAFGCGRSVISRARA